GTYGVPGGISGGAPSAFGVVGGLSQLGMGHGASGGGGGVYMGPTGGVYMGPTGGVFVGPGGVSGPAGFPSSPAFSIGRAITQGGFHSTVNNLMKTLPPMVNRLTEKGILNNLNTRLVGYVEKVRQLTIENALEAQLKAMTGSSPVMPDPSITVDNYEATVTEMLKNINGFTMERVHLEIEVDNLRVAAEEIKSKYEFEAGVKFQLETDISNMKRDLDAAQEMKNDLTSKYTILQEDLTFHTTIHKEEMAKLSTKFGKYAATHSSMIEVDSGKSINLMEALSTLRNEYETAAQRNRVEAEAYCTSKV
uniref:Zgc:136930 n=1 Tax=Petromyzon marinus TaxID=7757 RepID=S4RSC9_PETMA